VTGIVDQGKMHRYQVAEKLGDGTYGEVLRATNKQSGEVVAIKRYTPCKWEGMKINIF
jgi:serine/threonine protein kinase